MRRGTFFGTGMQEHAMLLQRQLRPAAAFQTNLRGIDSSHESNRTARGRCLRDSSARRRSLYIKSASDQRPIAAQPMHRCRRTPPGRQAAHIRWDRRAERRWLAQGAGRPMRGTFNPSAIADASPGLPMKTRACGRIDLRHFQVAHCIFGRGREYRPRCRHSSGNCHRIRMSSK